MDYKEKIKMLPASPGVYIMKGDEGQILYVGKAASLRKRVSSYFRPRRRLTGRLDAMVDKVRDIAYMSTSTEAEALIYENNLIKQLCPKYNVALKDDKSYPMLKLTANEKFPRLFITRQKKDDGAVYYGPYANAKLLREALISLRQMFPLRNCGRMPKNLCLNYHIKQCLAPCAGLVDEAKYGWIVSELKLFLEGKKEELVKLLSNEMLEASRAENFEEAARLKARIEALSSMRERVIYSPADEMEELRSILQIRGSLETIEAFDVSSVMGKEAVGSMVFFYRGRPRKNEYRKFKVQTVCGIDDYAMIREIVKRRYSRLAAEKKHLPDLILIDGGKGHVNTAAAELEKLGLSGIKVIGIAKEFEHIYLKDKNEPLVLPRESKALHLLERIRDEAHRFAISYHSKLRSKRIELSELDGIAGIGRKRKGALMKYFGAVDRIKTAGLEELLKVEGMDEKTARNIIAYFKE